MKHQEYHLYTDGSSLNIVHVHITKDMAADIMLLQDDVCRLSNQYEDAYGRFFYDIDQHDLRVRCDGEDVELGSHGYEGFEQSRHDWSEDVFVSTRIVHNINGGGIGRYSPSSIEEAFELVDEEHHDELLDTFEYCASPEYSERKLDEYRALYEAAKTYAD